MATIIYVSGETKEIEPANGTDFKLREVQSIVRGYVATVDLVDDMIMIINDEGKLEGLPRNEAATKLAALPTAQERQQQMQELRKSGVFIIDATGGEEDYIAGNVLVCRNDEFR